MPIRKSTCKNPSSNSRVDSQFTTRYPTRVVDTSQKHAGVSSNWKLDYYKVKHLSFAQVLKRAISNRSSSPKKVNTPNSHVVPVTKKAIHKSLLEKIPTKRLVPTVGLRKVQPRKAHHTTTNKVSADIRVPCKNRFQVLSIDTIVDSSPDTETCNSIIIQVRRKLTNKVSDKNHHHASKNDAKEKWLKLILRRIRTLNLGQNMTYQLGSK